MKVVEEDISTYELFDSVQYTTTRALSPTKIKEEEEEVDIQKLICVDGKPNWGYASWACHFLD